MNYPWQIGHGIQKVLREEDQQKIYFIWSSTRRQLSALPSTLRLSYRTLISYKPSSKKAPRHEQSVSLQETHEECLHAFSKAQRE